MARAGAADRGLGPHAGRGDRRVEEWAEGHQHSRSRPERHPVGPGHRAGEHDPARRGRPNQLPHGGRDVDPPVPRPVRPGPRVEPSHQRSCHRHPQRRHPWRWRLCRHPRGGPPGHRDRSGDRRRGRRNDASREERGQEERPPAATGLGRCFGIRRQHGTPRRSDAMASFGLPRTLPGDDGRRTVTHENVDNHVRGAELPGARTTQMLLTCAAWFPRTAPSWTTSTASSTGPAIRASGRPASSPGAGAPPWCASGRRVTR
jgi:hypothetical protein